MADNVTKILTIDLDASSAINGIVRLNEGIEANNKLMAQNKQEIAANNAAMKQEGANIDQLKAKNNVLKQSNEELVVKTRQLKEEKRTLQKEVQNEIRQKTAEEGSLRQLRAELSNLTKQYDNLSRAERNNVNVGGKLKAQINQVTTEIKAAEEGTQRYYRNVGNYQNAILNAIGMNNGFARSLIGITNASGGVNGAMASMGTSIKAFGQSLMGLLTNPVFLAIAGIVGAGLAFKWFYDYNKGVEEATRLTREFTGVTGQELRNLRAEIQATANAYGKEYKEVLEAVDSVMSHYHITAQEALDVINKGFAAGADLNGDFLQNLKQYAPTFHDAGIEADQLVAILQQTRSGIFSQQGLDAIRMGSARIREMSDSTAKALEGIGINAAEMERKLREGSIGTFEAIKQVSGAIQSMPDNAKEVGDVMTQVFGRQGRLASQEMIESLQEMETELDAIVEKAGEHGKALDENREATAELEKNMADLFQTGEHGWEDLWTLIKTYVIKQLNEVIKKIITIRNQFVKMYNESAAFRTVVRIIMAAFVAFGKVTTRIWNSLYTGFRLAITWLGAFVEAFKSAFDIFGDLAKGFLVTLLGNIELGVSMIGKAMGRSIKDTMGSFKIAASESGAIWAEYTQGVIDDINDIMKAYSSLKDHYDLVEPSSLGEGGEGDGGGGGGTSPTTSPTTTSSGTKGGTTNETEEQKKARKAREEFEKRMQDLIKQGEALEMQALNERSKREIAAINERAEAEKAAIIKKYGERALVEKEASAEALAAYDKLMADVDARRDKAIQDLNAKLKKEANEDAQKLIEALMAGEKEGSDRLFAWRMQQLELMKEAELAALDANERLKTENKETWEAMRLAITAKYAQQEQALQQEQAQKLWEIQKTKLTAMSETFGSIGELFEAFGEENKAMLVIQKTLALAQVMMAQAVAIANAVKAGSNAVTPWQMIAQIAASVAAVTTAMMSAFKSLNSAKFATGGYVRGAGTGTSDSIPVRVSNGESIMNANTTAMFSGLLSSLNQLGGGVPIQATQTAASVKGEDMLARAVARGVAMLPAPVVSVEDINRGQRQVQVMNERATL